LGSCVYQQLTTRTISAWSDSTSRYSRLQHFHKSEAHSASERQISAHAEPLYPNLNPNSNNISVQPDPIHPCNVKRESSSISHGQLVSSTVTSLFHDFDPAAYETHEKDNKQIKLTNILDFSTYYVVIIRFRLLFQ